MTRKYTKPPRDGCAGVRDYWGDFDCDYAPNFPCEDCMYCKDSGGRKNPQAKCNQQPEDTSK